MVVSRWRTVGSSATRFSMVRSVSSVRCRLKPSGVWTMISNSLWSSCGMKSLPTRAKSGTVAASTASDTTTITQRWRSDQASTAP